MRQVILFLFLGLVLSQAQASSRVTVGHLQGSLPVETIAVLDSAPGETRAKFIQRAAQVLDRYTTQTGFEGCSRLWVAPSADRWGMQLVTNRSHIGCTLLDDITLSGLVKTQESLHSHPPIDRYRVNASDRIFLGGRWRLREVRQVEGERFSSQDRHVGAGYMVHRGRLYYQGQVSLSSAI